MKPILAIVSGSSALFAAYFLNGNQPFFQTSSNLKCPVLKDVQSVKNQMTNPL
ncbi:unnamed protein product [Paramecium primaurelia]|uniref:Uncharacterized protein n=1 Tax=Paramecium primaurelia TaxID=5886 RepID=A0A8S1NG80_PARPR|nr:unnamed protein product [Paramecium primaurelia]